MAPIHASCPCSSCAKAACSAAVALLGALQLSCLVLPDRAEVLQGLMQASCAPVSD